MNATTLPTQWTSDRILEERTKKGWSQQELADRLGCRMQTVSEWENGKYIPQNAYQKLLTSIFRK